jgi:protoheme IX farnesyltransferase
MAAEPVLAALDVSGVQRRRVVDSEILFDYLALTKPEVNFLIIVTTFAGFYLACVTQSQDVPFLRLINTVLGTLLVASGAGTLNQYIERTYDAEMRRTARRPLAAGRLTPSAVLAFGVTLSAAGSIYLAAAVNGLASALALFTLLSYLFVYTPLKRTTPLCTVVGAVPGAMPPLIGWAAATGDLSWQALRLFALVFLWQFPHFMAIAWMYRQDYDRAGYRVLPRYRSKTLFAAMQTLLPLLALLPVGILPALVGHATALYGAGALVMSFGFLYYGAQFVFRKSISSARRLLAASIVYLPAIFALLIVFSR